jgi:hypothetical protein
MSEEQPSYEGSFPVSEEWEGTTMRLRMVDYMKRAPVPTNIGCYAAFRPEMVAAFSALVPPTEPADGEAPTLFGNYDGKTPDGDVPLAALMRITGESDISEDEQAELLALVGFPASKAAIGFEKWSKIMIDSTRAMVDGPKVGEKQKGGFFGLF